MQLRGPTLSILLATALLAAGCITQGDAPGAPEGLDAAGLGSTAGHAGSSLPPGTPLALHFGPCLELYSLLPVPMGPAEEAMPPGFAPLPMDPGGQLAVAVAVGFTCERIVDPTEGPEGTGMVLEDARTIAVVLASVPPEAYRAGHIQYYAIPLGGLANQDALAEVYRAWGLGEAVVAPVSFDLTDAMGQARTGRVAAQGQGLGLDLRVTSTVEEPQEANAFRVFAVREDGSIAGAIDWTWPAGATTMETGTAALTIEGSLPGLALHAQAGLGYHYYGDYVYDLVWVELD